MSNILIEILAKVRATFNTDSFVVLVDSACRAEKQCQYKSPGKPSFLLVGSKSRNSSYQIIQGGCKMKPPNISLTGAHQLISLSIVFILYRINRPAYHQSSSK